MVDVMKMGQSKYQETAELMIQAFLILLENKEYAYITVKEICLKAGVHRSTFYLHYETVDDLLEETVRWVQKQFYESFQKSDDMQQKIRIGNLDDIVLITPEYLIPYLTFIKENRKLFQLIHEKPHLFQAEETFTYFYKTLFEPIMERFSIPKKEQRYVLAYYSHGILAVIDEWIKQDFQDSIEDVVAVIIKYFPTHSFLEKKEELQ